MEFKLCIKIEIQIKEIQDLKISRMALKKIQISVFFKRKSCKFCDSGKHPDYKDFEFLKKFITEQGKILPKRITGTSAKHQRRLALEIKRARYMALLPFVKK